MLTRFLTGKRVVIGAYLSLGAFLLAHTVNAFVADALRPPPIETSSLDSITLSEPQATSPRALADAIVTSGLFPLPPAAGDSSASGQTSVPVAPPLEVAKKVALVGTVFGQQGGIMAILEDLPTKKQNLYRMGEQIPAVGALSAIEKNRVLFRAGTQEEWLDLALTQELRSGAQATATSAPVPRPSGPQLRVLERREIDAALADPTRLLTHAQAIPNLKNGKLDGFRLAAVVPLGFFDKIGLRNNDVLQRINGVELRDPGIVLTLFQQLRNEQKVRVDLFRDSQPQTLTYDIR